VLRAGAQLLGVLVVVATALPLALPRARAWWIRLLDFPRLQIAVLGVVACAGLLLTREGGAGASLALPALTAAAVAVQAAHVWRYTPLAPREVQRARSADPARRIALVIANVLQDNRNAERLLRAVRATDASVVLCLETDAWWCAQLDALRATHPYTLRHPLPNTYGMALHSRWPLEDAHVAFLVQDDVPSVHATLRLPSGVRVRLHGLHPRPPVPTESDSSVHRDAELVVVGKQVQDDEGPVIVCGDLNDVAWSRTTRLFQKLSGLLDPRKGRGFFGTFPARRPLLRVPLDHVFHSPDFRLVEMRLLPDVGSDHLPVYVALSHEPRAQRVQQAPENDAAAEQEARETVAEAASERTQERAGG